MAVRVKKTSLTTEQVTSIRKHLCLQPQAPKVFNPQQNWYTNRDVKESILFYKIEGDDILLPYYFYGILTGEKPNGNKKYIETNFEFTSELRPYQEPTMEEAIEHLKNHGTSLLALWPGYGKSICGAYLSQWCHTITIVFYHRQILGQQWLATFKECTDAKVWLVEEPEEPSEHYDVILCMDTQFYKLAKKITNKIGCVIIDEAHAFCTPSRVECWLGCEPKYVISLTATPDREDEMHSMRQAVCGLHGIYRINPNPFTIIRFITGITIEAKKNKQGTIDWNNLVNSLCEDDTRNSYIIEFVQSNLQFKILILTWRKGHAKMLHEQLNKLGIKTAIMAGTSTTYSDSKVLVGTISKIGTGFDEKSACADFSGERINLLLMVGTTKSENVIEQTVGRVFRATDPYVVFFYDNVPTIKKHYSIFRKWALTEPRNAKIYDMKSSTCIQKDRRRLNRQEETLDFASDQIDQLKKDGVI